MEISLTSKTIQVVDDQGEVFAEYPRPTSGAWVFSPSEGLTTYFGQPVQPNEFAASFDGVNMTPIAFPTADEDGYKPLRNLPYADFLTFVDGLTTVQLRKVVAWLLWIKRDELPDDIRNRI